MKEEDPMLDLKVLMLNVNQGHNPELMEVCHTLLEYAEYTAVSYTHLDVYKRQDLCFMALSWLEMDLPLQIYVPGRKEPLVKVRIQGTDGHVQFRVVCQDMIGRLSLFDQRGNDLSLFVKLPFSHVDPCSGIPEFFPVFPVSEPGVIRVFVGNRAVIDFFRTAVADIGSPVKPDAALFFKVSAGLVAGRTGCAFDSAEDNLSACLLYTSYLLPTGPPGSWE